MKGIELLRLNGKPIGRINHDIGVYITYRDKSHMFRKFGDGFGASMKLLDYLYLKWISIFIVNFEDSQRYIVKAEEFLFHGEEWNDGEDEQLVLPLKFWRKEIPKEVEVQTTFRSGI